MKKPDLKKMFEPVKIKEFIQKYIINNLGYKILAVAFAFALWLVILNVTDPEYTRTINNMTVEILNEDAVRANGRRVYTITSGETTAIILTGKRSIISSLSPSDFLVTADFQELSITNAVPIKAELTGDMSRYAGQVDISTKDTSMIINWENMTEKVVPVELEYTGELDDSIVIDEANISTKRVTVSAPESIAESAQEIVVTVDSTQITSDITITAEPELRSEDGSVIKVLDNVSLDVDTIDIEFKVSYKKEVPIVVNGTGKPAAGYTFNIELSSDTITVKGTQDDIDELRAITIPNGVINISGATQSSVTEIDLADYLPDDIVVYGESSVITVTVNVEPIEEESINYRGDDTEDESQQEEETQFDESVNEGEQDDATQITETAETTE